MPVPIANATEMKSFLIGLLLGLFTASVVLPTADTLVVLYFESNPDNQIGISSPAHVYMALRRIDF